VQGRFGLAIRGVCALAVMACAVPAYAGRTTNTMRTDLTVYSGCSLKTRPLMFVTPNALVNVVVDSTTTVTVKCTPNTAFTVDIDKGQHPNGINRRMYSAQTNSYIAYDVYRDSPRTNVWGTGQLKNVSGNSGSGAPLDLLIYGRIPLSTKIKAGDYIDTLVVTLNF
jgi:spore coat protein U-like protein